MSDGHRHDRGGSDRGPGVRDRGADLRRLALVLGLVVAYMVAELIGGLITNSLALLADAGHMLSDAGSLGLALFAIWIARRPSTPQRTYGYHRTEILAALANGAALVAVAVFVLVEAGQRLRDPPEVDGPVMLAVAAGGLLVNVVGLAALHAGRERSLNLRGAWLHVLTDTLGSVQAIAAGALIWAFGWTWADPVASALIAVLVAWSSWTLLRDSVNVLMEATPRHLDAGEVRAALAAVDGIEDVHDLHLWTITSGFESLSAHARVTGRDRDEVLEDLRATARGRFDIEHCTFQLESGEGCAEGRCD